MKIKKIISTSLKTIALILTIISVVLISMMTFWNFLNKPQYDPEFWYEDLIEFTALIWTIAVLLFTVYRLFRKLTMK